MNILLTGASGLLGSHVLKWLSNFHDVSHITISFNKTKPHIYNPNNKISFVYCNLADSFGIKTLLELSKPTHIIHLAGAANIRQDHPHAVLDNNINATYNLLDATEWYVKTNKLSPIDFIFSSSILVYGTGTNMFEENDKLQPNTLYGIAKITCEQMIELYAQKHIIRPRVLRFCGIVGKEMSHGRLSQVLHGTTQFYLMGKAPGSYLPYISIDTATTAVIKCLNYNKPKLLCNVANKNAIPLETAMRTMAKACNKQIEINWDNSDVPNTELWCHTERIKYELGMDMPENSEYEIECGVHNV